MKISFVIIAILVSILIFAIASVSFLGFYFSVPQEDEVQLSKSAQWREGKFHNLDARPNKKRSLKRFLKFMLGKDKSKWEPWVEIEQQAVPTTLSSDFVQFINHSTALIRLGDLHILTDPIFSDRCSPIPFAGPKRVHQPGIKLEDLPQIDVILISHNHYDHLDLKTLKALQKKDNPLILSGIGQAKFLSKEGFDHFQLFDWWQGTKIKETHFTFVPGQHFSSRGTFDRNKVLWGGFVIQSENKNIYFGGDTGYGSFVEHIANRYPKGFDLALIPIGAYLPQSIMKYVHINPEEAFKMHQQLKSRKSLGIHWGTFQLTLEARLDPVKSIESLKSNYQDNTFKVLEPGQWMNF